VVINRTCNTRSHCPCYFLLKLCPGVCHAYYYIFIIGKIRTRQIIRFYIRFVAFVCTVNLMVVSVWAVLRMRESLP
jgi:hypothetical protein